MHELPCALSKFQGIGCSMIGGKGDGVFNLTSSGREVLVMKGALLLPEGDLMRFFEGAGIEEADAESLRRNSGQRFEKGPPQRGRVYGDASDPLPPRTLISFHLLKELTDSVIAFLLIPCNSSLLNYDIYKRSGLGSSGDFHDKAYMRLAVRFERTNTTAVYVLRGSAMKLCMIWTKILLCWTCAQKLKLCRGKLTGFRVTNIQEKGQKNKQTDKNQARMKNLLLCRSFEQVVVSAAKITVDESTFADIVLVMRNLIVYLLETPKVLLLAWEKFFEIKHREKQHPPEDIQELIRKLLEDVQNISEELAEYINSPSWNRPAFYFDDDDGEEVLLLNQRIISLVMCTLVQSQGDVRGFSYIEYEHEEYISLIERLLYDNSYPRPPEDFHAIPNTIIESLPTFLIPVEDSDSLMEEIGIFPSPDDSIPLGIESDD
ncbi:hypothetical protein Tco_0012657 [Tanacetum coccineum]